MPISGHVFLDAEAIGPPRQRGPTLIATLIIWHHRHRTRRHLRNLDRRELVDVGIDPLARQREIAKWFWEQ
jgi:uncharacterized protein YjiS (DUF1127 family)